MGCTGRRPGVECTGPLPRVPLSPAAAEPAGLTRAYAPERVRGGSDDPHSPLACTLRPFPALSPEKERGKQNIIVCFPISLSPLAPSGGATLRFHVTSDVGRTVRRCNTLRCNTLRCVALLLRWVGLRCVRGSCVLRLVSCVLRLSLVSCVLTSCFITLLFPNKKHMKIATYCWGPSQCWGPT